MRRASRIGKRVGRSVFVSKGDYFERARRIFTSRYFFVKV